MHIHAEPNVSEPKRILKSCYFFYVLVGLIAVLNWNLNSHHGLRVDWDAEMSDIWNSDIYENEREKWNLKRLVRIWEWEGGGGLFTASSKYLDSNLLYWINFCLFTGAKSLFSRWLLLHLLVSSSFRILRLKNCFTGFSKSASFTHKTTKISYRTNFFFFYMGG